MVEMESYLDSFWESEHPAAGPQQAPATTCDRCGESIEDCEKDEAWTCTHCGNVLMRQIDLCAEYRFFGNDERGSSDPSRVGAPVDARFPESSLGTMILSTGGNGRNGVMARIRRYHMWNMLPYRERSLLHVFETFALTASNHGLNQQAIDTGKQLYLSLIEHCDKRGLSRNSVIASCIYTALKQVGQPRKPKEVADMFHLSTAQFTKSFKHFQEVFAFAQQRNLLPEQITPSDMRTTSAADYCSLPISKLPLTRSQMAEVERQSIALAQLSEQKNVSPENMPSSLAAGVIAYVIGKKGLAKDIGHDRIAAASEVSVATLAKCLKKLEDYFGTY